MERRIARANIDHYISVLSGSDLTTQNRKTVTKLLIGEEDRFSHDLEQLQFAEDRAATCRKRADRQRCLMDSFAPGSPQWVHAERLLVNFESLAQFVEGFCRQMRRKVNDNSI